MAEQRIVRLAEEGCDDANTAEEDGPLEKLEEEDAAERRWISSRMPRICSSKPRSIKRSHSSTINHRKPSRFAVELWAAPAAARPLGGPNGAAFAPLPLDPPPLPLGPAALTGSPANLNASVVLR